MTSPSIQHNVDLTPFNTFGVAARARSYMEIRDVEQLRAVLQLRDPREPLLILGGGSNLLLTRDFPGLALHIKLFGTRIVEQDANATYVEAAAGENWHGFVRGTLDRGLAGLENLSLIPGSVGATPIQNIGAYGVEMKDTFHSLQAMDIEDGITRTFDRTDCAFAYRDSMLNGTFPSALETTVYAGGSLLMFAVGAVFFRAFKGVLVDYE